MMENEVRTSATAASSTVEIRRLQRISRVIGSNVPGLESTDCAMVMRAPSSGRDKSRPYGFRVCRGAIHRAHIEKSLLVVWSPGLEPTLDALENGGDQDAGAGDDDQA